MTSESTTPLDIPALRRLLAAVSNDEPKWKALPDGEAVTALWMVVTDDEMMALVCRGCVQAEAEYIAGLHNAADALLTAAEAGREAEARAERAEQASRENLRIAVGHADRANRLEVERDDARRAIEVQARAVRREANARLTTELQAAEAKLAEVEADANEWRRLVMMLGGGNTSATALYHAIMRQPGVLLD